MSDLQTLSQGWDHAAHEDPLFNILTLPGKDGGQWDEGEFFERGAQEIAATLAELEGLVDRRERALDFGCGVGRLTQALADHYKRVDGVDISSEMIRLARGYNRHGDRVIYRLNDAELPFDANSFDLVYTRIVLQHMPAELQRGYIGEFIRVIRPDGVAFVQLCTMDYRHPNAWLSMHSVSPETVAEWVDTFGGRVVREVDGLDSTHRCYVVGKR